MLLATCKMTHSFLHVPDCLYPLLERDLLTKMRAQIHFEKGGAKIAGPKGEPLHVMTLQLEDEYKLFEKEASEDAEAHWIKKYPQAWAETGGMGLAMQRPP